MRLNKLELYVKRLEFNLKKMGSKLILRKGYQS